MLQSHAQYKYLYNMFWNNFLFVQLFLFFNTSKILTQHQIGGKKSWSNVLLSSNYLLSRSWIIHDVNLKSIILKRFCGNFNHLFNSLWEVIYTWTIKNSMAICWSLFIFLNILFIECGISKKVCRTFAILT